MLRGAVRSPRPGCSQGSEARRPPRRADEGDAVRGHVGLDRPSAMTYAFLASSAAVATVQLVLLDAAQPVRRAPVVSAIAGTRLPAGNPRRNPTFDHGPGRPPAARRHCTVGLTATWTPPPEPAITSSGRSRTC